LLKLEVHSVKDWKDIVKKIKPLIIHNILFLDGDLGSGKTTFTRNLVNSLGSEDNVSSPTYSIVNEYDSSKGKIFHFDLYRLKSPAELYDINIEEYLENAYLNIIEWPQILEKEIPDLVYHKMKITTTKNNIRLIKFT